MALIPLIVFALALAWASGINVYATALLIGVLNATGIIVLPDTLQILSHPLILLVLGLLYFVEFVADKIPGFDLLWDGIQGFIRIPAGTLLAAAALTDAGPIAEISGALAGGTLAAATYLFKVGSRVLINTSPEPVSNWSVSFTEDLMVIGGIWLAVMYPMVFFVLLVVFIAIMVWLLPKLWRQIRKIYLKLQHWLSPEKTISPDNQTATEPALLEKWPPSNNT